MGNLLNYRDAWLFGFYPRTHHSHRHKQLGGEDVSFDLLNTGLVISHVLRGAKKHLRSALVQFPMPYFMCYRETLPAPLDDRFVYGDSALVADAYQMSIGARERSEKNLNAQSIGEILQN